jgi:hypothetical protein
MTALRLCLVPSTLPVGLGGDSHNGESRLRGEVIRVTHPECASALQSHRVEPA